MSDFIGVYNPKHQTFRKRGTTIFELMLNICFLFICHQYKPWFFFEIIPYVLDVLKTLLRFVAVKTIVLHGLIVKNLHMIQFDHDRTGQRNSLISNYPLYDLTLMSQHSVFSRNCVVDIDAKRVLHSRNLKWQF